MNYYYDPLDGACKSVLGAVSRETAVTFRLYEQTISGEADFSADFCNLVISQDDGVEKTVPMKKTDFGFSVTVRFHKIGLFFYLFDFGGIYLGSGRLRRGVMTGNPEPWQITVYDEGYRTPDWFKDGIMYQIFPDRFRKAGEYPVREGKILRRDWGGTPSYRPNEFGKILNNDFFGGNFNGVREKLDYLKSLHVSVIYFNPVFEAFSNHRYDTGDYRKIDSLLGTEEDFDALVKEAAEKGIRIILDGVFNHTGDDSRYFNKYGKYKEQLGAHQSPDSPYFDWYTFHDYPASYECWWGIETLPAVNESSASYQKFICGEDGVIKTWLRHGIAGYRLDVADELPDFFLQKIRKAVKSETPDAMIIGEVWEDASNKIAYGERRRYLQGFELDSVMNYPLKDAIISYVLSGNTIQLRETMAMLLDNYPAPTLHCLMNVLGTHDTPRILTVLGGKQCRDKDEMASTFLTAEEREIAKQKVMMAAVLQYTLPGVPCIYYGDENAMEGYRDPFCRGCFDWENMDEELGAFYRKLGEIRTEVAPEVFRDGSYREIFANASCIVYERRHGDRSVVVYVNNSATEYTLHAKGSYLERLTGTAFDGSTVLRAFSYGILTRSE